MKLVRDKIPAMYEAEELEPRENDRGDFTFRKVRDQEELILLLRLKLAEEIGEVLSAPSKGELTQELGDLLDAIDALISLEGINSDYLAVVRTAKHARLGGLLDGWVLE